MKHAQRVILLNGLIILLVGALCGVPYGQSITKGWGEEAVRAWRLAHFSLVFGGVWLLAVAAVSNLLVLGARGIKILVTSVVTSAYAFLLALLVAAAFGVRGIEATGPPANLVAFAGNTLASVASVVWAVVSIAGAVRALRDGE
jgi:Na+/H+-dicarboxylate symporter